MEETTMTKKQSTIGPSHTEAAKSGFCAGPTDEGLTPHHGPGFMTNQQRPTAGNIARDGKAKAHLAVPLHNSATKRQQSMNAMGHANESSPIGDGGQPADSTHPFAKPPAASFGKEGRGVPGCPNMRDANGMGHDPSMGRAVLASAVKSGGKV
jgi:hypothetical protein